VFIQVTLDKTHDKERAAFLFKKYRPSYIYAFNDAKNLHSGSKEVLAGAKTATEDDYVTFPEFRVFTLYLRIYAIMFDTFADTDGESEGRTEDDDSRVDKDEFMKWFHSSESGPKFKAFEDVNSDEDAEELFSYLDTDNSGLIVFSEWSASIKQMEIEEGTELGTLLKGDLVPTQVGKKKSSGAKPKRNATKETAAKNKTKRAATPVKKKTAKRAIVMPAKVAGAYLPSKRSSDNLKDFILAFQPFAERSIMCGKRRKRAFQSMDNNGNGKCSLAEISQFVRTTLKKEHDEVRGEELFDYYRPTYIRAFNASKAIAKTDDPEDDNYINFSEFRVLNAYICVYAGMGDDFFKIDGGDGVTEDDDRRVEMTEWIKAYSKFTSSTFIGLRGIETDEDASTVFKEMDLDAKGMVLLSEFCEYIRTKEMENKTPLGKLLYGNALSAKAVDL